VKEISRIILFSVASAASFEHFENTILNDVETSKFTNSEMTKFPKVRMWGAIDRSTNNFRNKWQRLKNGDILLFYKDKKYVATLEVTGTEDNSDIAKTIWGEKGDHDSMNIDSKSGETWQLIMYAIPENVKRTNVDYRDLNKLLGYKEEKFMPTRTLDFTTVRESILDDLVKKYGSVKKALESIGF